MLFAFHPVYALAGSGAGPGSGPEGAVSDSTLSTQQAVAQPAEIANFLQASASPAVRHVAQWVVDSGDNGDMPYIIIDKVNARVFVFDAGGRLQGAEPALLGMERGDRSAKGIGDQKLSAIRPEERTTPAGRFVASLGRDLHGQEILWIDYADALALHRVVKGQPSERRAQRLQSATSSDNRISYGCINVPVKFYEKVVSPAFTNTNGIVYILPETRPAGELFGHHGADADAKARVLAKP